MVSTPIPAPTPAATPLGWWTLIRWRTALMLLVIVTFAIRARYFGNPLIDVDEQFYLLTGDRMWQGALPYVDIWDRKPVGLFLLYAAMRLLGGDGVLQYQLVASGFAAATAVMIAIIARRVTSPAAALVAALAYIPALAMNGGQGGQTPVFYNLLMIVAAWLVLGLAAPKNEQTVTTSALVRRGAVAMLLVGVAMQIKYTAMFEGFFFGCALLWMGRRAGLPLPVLAGAALLWSTIALLPTVAAWGWYIVIGHGADFVQANFTSILARGNVGVSHAGHDLQRIAIRSLPFILPIALGEWVLRPWAPWRHMAGGSAAHRFVVGWLIAALAGFIVFGGYFDHYALPLLPPLAIVASPLFAIRERLIGPGFAALSLLGLFVAYPLDARKRERRHGDAAYADRITATIAPRLHGGCLYVFYGEPILYKTTHSCLPTRWSFPFHLSLAREAPALGIDAMAETRRILATRPPVIVDRLNDDDEINMPVQAFVRDTLRHDYRLVASFPHEAGRDVDQVWERSPAR